MKTHVCANLVIILAVTFIFIDCGSGSRMITKKASSIVDTTGLSAPAKEFALEIPRVSFGRVPKQPRSVVKIKKLQPRLETLPDKIIIGSEPRSRAAALLAEKINGINYLQKVVRGEKAHLVLGGLEASNSYGRAFGSYDYNRADSTLSLNPNVVDRVVLNFGLTKKNPTGNNSYYDVKIVLTKSSYELIWPEGMKITYGENSLPLYHIVIYNYDRLEEEIIRMVRVMTGEIYRETVEAGLSTSDIGD